MTHRLLSLHHVTATVDDAQEDLDFVTGALGLRLVKQTVNFDNHSVFHFYYGTERGAPGTLWTTFPYKGWGVPEGVRGAGQVVATLLSVPPGSLDWWLEHFRTRGVTAGVNEHWFGQRVVTAWDPTRMPFMLVESPGDLRAPWTGGAVDHAAAVRGLDGVMLSVRALGPSVEFLAELFGFETAAQDRDSIKLVLPGAPAGSAVYLGATLHDPQGRNGIGTIHHVAFAVATPEEQLAIREDLMGRGVQVTPVRDRQYFQSIYFREPGGVLYEIATMAPGFTVDEPLESLGERLKLPPWEEPHRATIEATLPAVRLTPPGVP